MEYIKLKDLLTEQTGGSAKEFAQEIDNLLKKHFPKSTTWAQFSTNLSESISIKLAIGTKSDWSSKIINNAPIEYGAIIFGIVDSKTTNKMSLESSVGASITIKPAEGSHMAYGRVRVPTRKTTGDETKILKAIEKVLIGLKTQAKKNLGNMTDDHQWVKKYI